MKILDTFKTDSLLSKWLKIGFYFVTGHNSDNVDYILNYLKNVLGYSDNDIIALAKHNYGLNKSGCIVW